jgi:cytochrome c
MVHDICYKRQYMQLKVLLLFVSLVIFAVGFVPENRSRRVSENTIPIVTITTPFAATPFEWNAIIPYAIEVSDREDGESKYDEISSREVLLWAKYLNDSSNRQREIIEQLKNIDPLVWMAQSTCFNCHALKRKLIGPSFESIATRYPPTAGLSDTLAKRIHDGTTGRWGDVPMPPHPEMPPERLSRIVAWILRHSSDPTEYYSVGLSGTFRSRQRPAKITDREAYLITAGYFDHGIDGKGTKSKLGYHSITLGR